MKFFMIVEFCKLIIVDCLGINNRCRQEYVIVLIVLVDNVLDLLCIWWGKFIIVNSGYCCLEFNVVVKGSKILQYMKGEVVDIDIGDRQ